MQLTTVNVEALKIQVHTQSPMGTPHGHSPWALQLINAGRDFHAHAWKHTNAKMKNKERRKE